MPPKNSDKIEVNDLQIKHIKHHDIKKDIKIYLDTIGYTYDLSYTTNHSNSKIHYTVDLYIFGNTQGVLIDFIDINKKDNKNINTKRDNALKELPNSVYSQIKYDSQNPDMTTIFATLQKLVNNSWISYCNKLEQKIELFKQKSNELDHERELTKQKKYDLLIEKEHTKQLSIQREMIIIEHTDNNQIIDNGHDDGCDCDECEEIKCDCGCEDQNNQRYPIQNMMTIMENNKEKYDEDEKCNTCGKNIDDNDIESDDEDDDDENDDENDNEKKSYNNIESDVELEDIKSEKNKKKKGKK
jgi:hypothetical protein